MGGNGPLANIDLAIRKELPKMIIGPTVAEAELEHLPFMFTNQIGGQI